MKNFKKILPFIVIAVVIVFGVWLFSYMNISGKRLDNIELLGEVPLRVDILDFYPNDPANIPVFTLTAEQGKQLQELLRETTFKRRFTSMTPTAGSTGTYYIFADWDNDGLYDRFVSIYDNGYMSIGRSTIYHQAKDSDFGDKFIKIIESNLKELRNK